MYTECTMAGKKTYVGKKNLWQERNQWILQETEIGKDRSFMEVLKYLIPSVKGNKMKLFE